MSGGHFDYKDMELSSSIFGYSSEPVDAFEDEVFSRLIWDALNVIHKYDWYISGDTGLEDYLKALQAFKKKWLQGSAEKRARAILEEKSSAIKKELYESFGVTEQPEAAIVYYGDNRKMQALLEDIKEEEK